MKTLIITLLSCAFLCNADQALTRDERIVALTILGEARGEGEAGMFAIACVINRRAWERRKTPAEICLQPKQFSVWNGTDRQGNYRLKRESELYYLWETKGKVDGYKGKLSIVMYVRDLARWLHLKNERLRVFRNGSPMWPLIDATKGANHYCTIKSNPYWSFKTEIKNGKIVFVLPKQSIKPVAIIGNHKFYKLP